MRFVSFVKTIMIVECRAQLLKLEGTACLEENRYLHILNNSTFVYSIYTILLLGHLGNEGNIMPAYS